MGCLKLTYQDDLKEIFSFHRKITMGESPVYQISSVKRNHLGNVLSVISDKVIPHANGTTVDYFLADLRQSQDYSPFGVTLYGRDFSSAGADEFRYGYQGSEADDELKGNGNSYTTEFRQLDPRLGRWLSIDPKASSMPWQSPYCSMDNNPIWFNDQLGDSTKFKIIGTEKIEVLDDGKMDEVEIAQEDFNNLKKVFDSAPLEPYTDDTKETCDVPNLDDYFEYMSRLGLGSNGYKLALEARKHIGSTDWAYDVSNPPFAANQNKCNQFVWDMCKEVAPNSLSNYTAGSPPRAGDAWGSPTKKINGTEIVNATTDNIKLGDIVGGKTNYRAASGHVEIVTGIDPISGKITSTGAGSTKVRTSTFIQSVLEGKMWSKHIYSPFAVRRLK